MSRIKVGILFGGKSVEHEVSLRSAKNVLSALDKNKYEPVLIAIDKSGKWLFYEDNPFLDNGFGQLKLAEGGDEIMLIPGENGLFLNLTKQEEKIKVDVVFPALHGLFG